MLNMCYILISLLCIPPDPVPETLQYLRINGQAFEMTWAQSAPTIDSVLDSYETVKTDAASVASFLSAVSNFSAWSPGDDPIEIYEIQTTIEFGFGGDRETVCARAFVGSQHAEFTLYVEDDQFHVDLSIDNGSGLFQEALEFEALSPVDWQPGSALQPLYIGSRMHLVCRCDTAGGDSCTAAMCDSIATCPLKNGTSCAWIGMVIVPLEPVEVPDPG